jgi:alpha-glucosidase
MKNFYLILSLSFCLSGNVFPKQSNQKLSTDSITIKSPDKQLIFTLKNESGQPAYEVSYKGKRLIRNSKISLDFVENGEFGKNLRMSKPVFKTINELYDLVVGKNKTVQNHCNEARIPLTETISPFRTANIIVRVFNDGVAFRYALPEQANWSGFSLKNENTEFRLNGNPEILGLLLPGFTTSHEGLYTRSSFKDLKSDTLMDVPALFDFQGTYMAITEAELTDYAGMYLTKHDGVLRSRLSPLPGKDGISVTGKLPHKSPWRVLMISDRVGDLLESNILTSLNEPCKIKDVAWIKPGKASWPWWNGTVVGDSSFKPANDFATNKYYIDFCSRNGIEYHSVVEANGHEWYFNNGKGYAPGTMADVTRPVEGLDMQKVCDYAKSKGVGIRLWVHWAALYSKLNEAFVLYEKWGISGLMVDFMDRDDQDMVNMQIEILQKAAEHHLHIQFHGAYKPTGMQRTYPNEFTREGTLNYEVDKWDNKVTPAHDLNIVFTRLLAGATDYHLGGFRAVPVDKFKVHYLKPEVMGTRCHMLAMYVVLESYLGLVCDYPEAYEGQPGFEFLKEVPTVWDHTKILDAKVSEYIITAREKNSEWFVGSITKDSRNETIQLSFLPPGKFTAEIYSDVPGQPNGVKKDIREVSSGSQIAVLLSEGGGMVMHISEKK